MADIKLNSQVWCDFVFEDKNKKYGAYRLRQSSSKRHLYAFGITVLLAVLVTAVPMLISEVQKYRAANAPSQAIDQVLEMTKLEIEDRVPEENIIKEATAPPPPPLKSTVRFVPPIIAPDEEVADNVEVHTQDDLLASREQISIADVIGDDDDNGIDIRDLEEQKIIVEEAPKVFEIVEQMPSFPGGQEEMMKWLSANMNYPVDAQERGVQGRVVVRFVVTKTGSVEDIKVLRGIDPSCDREAIRVVKAMPKWNPGRQNGEAVAVYFNLPVLFRLKQ